MKDASTLAPGYVEVPAAAGRATVLSLIVLVAHPALPARAGAEAPEPLAEIDGDAITAKDLEQMLGATLSQVEQQIYNLKRQQLEALSAERLLAQEAARRRTCGGSLSK